MRATPDGRKAGAPLKFGRGQSGGHDRNGLTALLKSLATVDEHCIGCGSTVTNISLEKSLIENDDNFEKTVDLFEAYFRMGGMHFQLTYASKEEMLDAKVNPDKHKNLRVRVSGFSDYFTNLYSELQDAVIERESHN
jgi:formate C-acetyltransferase